MPISFVGLQKTTLIDFPGRVAAVLFIPGCNFRCPYCHNPELVAPRAPGSGPADGLVPLEAALALIEKRRRLLDGVVISGGEPLLHGETAELAARIRAAGFLVKIDTNGSFPDRLAAIRPDFIAMDLKTDPSRYGERGWFGDGDVAERVRASVAWIRASGIPHEFRTTVVPGVVGADELVRIASLLGPEDAYVLNPFRPGVTLDPAFAAAAPYTDAELDALLAAVKPGLPRARIRGR